MNIYTLYYNRLQYNHKQLQLEVQLTSSVKPPAAPGPPSSSLLGSSSFAFTL